MSIYKSIYAETDTPHQGFAPGSPEAIAAIDRVGAAINGKNWDPGAYLKAKPPTDRSELLTEDDVRWIRKMHRQGVPVSKIAEGHSVSYSTVYNVIRGHSWAHVPDEVES